MNQIGWTPKQLDFAVVQGTSGAQRLTMVVTQADGSALPTYDGWACEIVIVSPYTQRIAINLSPSVTGNAGAKTLVADMVFVTATTAELPIGVYLGGVTMIDPDGNREPPAKITLTIQHGFPAP